MFLMNRPRYYVGLFFHNCTLIIHIQIVDNHDIQIWTYALTRQFT